MLRRAVIENPDSPRRDQGAVIGPLESVLRHPFLAALPLIVAVVVAGVIGLTRDAEFSAQARVSVGRVDVPAYTLQGVVIGNSTLAASYARAISAQPVVEGAASSVGLTPAGARTRLAASPVPGSTLVRVDAVGRSEAEAIRLANAAAKSLITYIERLEIAQQETGLQTEYRASRKRIDEARQRFARFRAADLLDSARVKEARVDLELARLRTSTLRNQIRVSGGVDGAPRNVLQLLAPAAEADSDRSSVLQRLLFIALAAGAVLGAALALLRANREILGRRRE